MPLALLPWPFTVCGHQLKNNPYTTILVLKPVGIKGLIDVMRYRSVQGRIVFDLLQSSVVVFNYLKTLCRFARFSSNDYERKYIYINKSRVHPGKSSSKMLCMVGHSGLTIRYKTVARKIELIF